MIVKPMSDQEYVEKIKPSKPESDNKKSLTSKKVNTPKVSTTDQDVFVQTSQEGEPDYFRHTLPSRGFFYTEKKDLLFRALKVKDLKKIQHFLTTSNITHLIDAIQNCIENDVDVRDLTLDDFFFVTFQIVFSSHLKPEYKFTWTSFYGNENEEIITQNQLELNELDTKTLLKEVPNYQELNLVPSTVRSYEVLYNNRYKEGDSTTWSEEKTSLYEDVGRYLNEASLEDQFTRAENMEVKSDEFRLLKKFRTLIKHDIKTELKTFDKLFEPEKALETLQARLTQLEELPAELYEEVSVMSESMNIEKIKEEISRISTGLTQTQEVRAKEETIPFRINLADFVQPLFV